MYRTLMTAFAVALFSFSLIGCESTPKAEDKAEE